MKVWMISLAGVGLLFASLKFTSVVQEHNAELDRRIAAIEGRSTTSPRAVGSERAQQVAAAEMTTAPVANSMDVKTLATKLSSVPPGPEAVKLTQQLEGAITDHNRRAYADELLATDHPAVERAMITALARSADGNTVTHLVSQYGSIPAERRGRVLQVLENAQNPAAVDALVQTVEMDKSEKRSPLLTHAMNGLANIGSMEAVEALLQQVASDNETFAYMALERVRSEQGREMIRTAAQGNKDSAQLRPDQLVVLQRIGGK